MRLNCIIRRIIIFSVIISILLLTSGCTDTPKTNLTKWQITPLNSTTPITSLEQSVSQSQTQDPIKTSTTIVMATITPHFYGTISYGANRSSALNEDQAWKSAETFFLKIGLPDIQPNEIEHHGQYIWKNSDKDQEMAWSFHVHRIVKGVNSGGTIFIDAYDGHVISFSGYQ